MQLQLRKMVDERTKKIENQTKELKYLSDTKLQFFNNIAHELRNPLTLILGPAKIIERNIQDEKQSKEDLKYIKSIQKNGQKLLNLSDEIASLAKLETHPEELHQSSVSLFLLMQKILVPYEGVTSFQKKELYFNYNLDKELYLFLDVPKFEKIVNNLISNAFKYSPQGAKITISVNSLPEQKLQIEVSDTGYGIDAEDLPFIFKPYYRSQKIKMDHDPLDAKGGLGIGLPFAQSLARILQGEVHVANTSKAGTTFVFEMPLEILNSDEMINSVDEINQEENEMYISTENPIGVSVERMSHILIVEDHKEISQFIRSLLEPYYKLSFAYSGKEALEVLASHEKEKTEDKISLIVSDIMMPEMDGLQFLEKIKKHEKWKQLPFIFLTGYTSSDSRIKALKFGIEDYLIKPFEPEELITRISVLLNNQQQRNTWIENEEKEGEINLSTKSFYEEEWLISFNQVIYNNLENYDLDVELLAKELAISKRQLTRKVKMNTGLTPGKYIQELRLQKARKLLEMKSYDSVSAVCYSVGLKTPSYFSRQFKLRFGRLPSSYLE
ncbi:MAG: response regulator [Saprospiraceae bacterium]